MLAECFSILCKKTSLEENREEGKKKNLPFHLATEPVPENKVFYFLRFKRRKRGILSWAFLKCISAIGQLSSKGQSLLVPSLLLFY